MLGYVLIPLVLAGLLPLVSRFSRKFLLDFLPNVALFCLLLYSLASQSGNIDSIVRQLFWFGQPVGLNLCIDGFSRLMLFLIYLVSFAVSIYSVSYADAENLGSKAYYYGLILVIVAGLSGLVMSSDIFSIYVFLEVAAVASYGLTAYSRGAEETEGAFKYLLLSAVASGLILFGIVLLYSFTGALDLGEIFIAARNPNNRAVVMVCMSMFIAGFGLKSALVPFHTWMPDAYTASPATLPALSSGLLIKVSGVYALTRIISVFGLNPAVSLVVVYAGVVSVVIGTLLAIGQTDFRRLLAYSSISQVGYVFLGIGLCTPLGITGGLFHLFNHSLAKSLLFFNAGSLEQSTGTRDLSKFGGLGKRMPITAGTSVVGSLSVAGIPPLNGFWSKLIIIIALVQSGHPCIALIGVLASVVTLWYFLLVQSRAFFGKLNDTWKGVRESGFWMSSASLFMALICIFIGIFFALFVKSWIKPAASAIMQGMNYVRF